MEQKFLEFVAEVLDADVRDISLDSSYTNGDWDSLMHLRLMVEICDEYDVDIPSEKLGSIKTLRDFTDIYLSNY